MYVNVKFLNTLAPGKNKVINQPNCYFVRAAFLTRIEGRTKFIFISIIPINAWSLNASYVMSKKLLCFLKTTMKFNFSRFGMQNEQMHFCFRNYFWKIDVFYKYCYTFWKTANYCEKDCILFMCYYFILFWETFGFLKEIW